MRGRRNRRQRGLAIYASSGSRRVSTNKSVPENDANSQQTSPDSPSLWPCLALVRKPALEKRKRRPRVVEGAWGHREGSAVADLDKNQTNGTTISLQSITPTSDQARLRPELKHITKGRKRN